MSAKAKKKEKLLSEEGLQRKRLYGETAGFI